MGLEPTPGTAGKQCPDAVTEYPHDNEQQTEHDHLQRGMAPADVNKLGKKGQEEQRRLRVQHIDDGALPEYATEGLRRPGAPACVEIPLHELAYAEVDQIGRPQILEHTEGRRGGRQQC